MRQRVWLFVLLGLLLAACASGGKPISPASQPIVPGVAAIPKPTDTALPTMPPETLPTLPPSPTNTPISAPQPVSDSSGSMPGCTAKSLFATPNPTVASLFPPVSEEDWARGPKTASVTLIEYSDFQ